MTRGKALQPGRYYHIYNRGNNRENVFLEDRNYRYFLKLYAHHVQPVAETFAYCLMRNHFHLLVRIKSEAELQMSDFSEKSDISTRPTRAFAALFTAYTKAINKAYSRTGRLFQEHFGRIEVAQSAYFTNLIFYIHFNPEKHGFVKNFRDWSWSSYRTLNSTHETKLDRDEVMRWFGDLVQFEHFHTNAVDERLITKLLNDDLV